MLYHYKFSSQYIILVDETVTFNFHPKLGLTYYPSYSEPVDSLLATELYKLKTTRWRPININHVDLEFFGPNFLNLDGLGLNNFEPRPLYRNTDELWAILKDKKQKLVL